MTEQFILTLLERFESGAVRELELSDGVSRLALSKNTGAPARGVAVRGDSAEAPVHAPAAAPPAAESRGAEAAAGTSSAGGNAGGNAGANTIHAPIVGTFYAAPGPDSPAFVEKGSVVKKGDTLCILEAMKMMNKLEAEFDCEIVAIHAQSGDLVEYGQALFEVRAR
ncbi:MAG: acetyl-CoA carboxylase biotin carboxyl carrier protein [Spirochaetaceae bacterium]|jgi:acetyl-CoA carboxylase biotin carboxyl carrier protein|nr:acetyl-CoA carboxylase biotin carboxyl carrier protein [Spirochaetaceae bacterium]